MRIDPPPVKTAPAVLFPIIAVMSLIWPAFCRAGLGRTEIDLSGPDWNLWQDRNAQWENDPLFLPPVDISKLPSNPPTAGWDILQSGMNVSVPGTAEEYLQKTPGPAGDITGVTWWTRSIQIPPADSPRRILLRFEAARLRTEVYVKQKLVGYDVIGNTPFEVDLSNAVRAGEKCTLAVRITDPGGNFDWKDSSPFRWGKFTIPASHGFGGITGQVKLITCDDVYVDDLYMQNLPAITDVNALITIKNTHDEPVVRDVIARVIDRANPSVQVAGQTVKNCRLLPGSNVIPIKLSASQAKLWDLDHPNLYVCQASLAESDQLTDTAQQTFGFRWFAPVGIGSDAMFRLNGKRIVLRSAISWGFFPINGIYATDEIATRQISVAKAMGLNMLNFHRTVGQPVILDKADELGLLYYEEPGGYKSGDSDPFAQAIVREKFLRMVRRDRSHPSMAIFSMSNEASGDSDDLMMTHELDMQDAHKIDPSRTIIRSSSFAVTPDIASEDSLKMHMRPFDDRIYLTGWFDHHHAGGPAVWTESFYRSPTDYYNRIADPQEIIFWGEEGAISTPPRLGLIKQELAKAPNLGWDGAMYLDWYKIFDDFLTQKNLRAVFPTVDSLCEALGDISMEHQGRKIQVIRINNTTDAYCINGWESEIIENHSGIVDCFRNPKGDADIMAYYNQPLYVAVMPRSQFTELPGKVVVDFHLINEKNLSGPRTLAITATNPLNRTTFTQNVGVNVQGGDVYGQLLVPNITVPIAGPAGQYTISAALTDSHGNTQAVGHDRILAVDWRSQTLPPSGAVWDGPVQVRRFLAAQKKLDVPQYTNDLGKVDWVVAARAPDDRISTVIPRDQLHDSTGQPGLIATFFDDPAFAHKTSQRQTDSVNISVPDGSPPDPSVATLENYSVRWDGMLTPPTDGNYTFAVRASGQVQLTIAGKSIIEPTFDSKNRPQPIPTTGVTGDAIHLDAGKPVSLRVEWKQATGSAHCELLWSVPTSNAPDPSRLLDRVSSGQTTLVVLENADAWMKLANSKIPIGYHGAFVVGSAWTGGDHFVISHRLFQDLPTDAAMDWPYQAIVRNGKERSGLLLDSDELIAGAFHANVVGAPLHLGTAVGIVPFGKGSIIVSTLDICSNLSSPDNAAAVARKLLCNFIDYAGSAHH